MKGNRIEADKSLIFVILSEKKVWAGVHANIFWSMTFSLKDLFYIIPCFTALKT